jgi:hypothetical protein
VIATRDDAPNYGFVTDLVELSGHPVTDDTDTARARHEVHGPYTSGVYGGSGLTAVPDFTKGMNAFRHVPQYLTGSGACLNSLARWYWRSAAGTATWVAGYWSSPGKQNANDGHGNVERFRHLSTVPG